jgi:elongation factor G
MSLPVEKKRNIALVGHGGSGKTTLSEAILFSQAAITRFGKVDEGNTVSDYTAEEIRKKHSIYSGILPMAYKGYQLNVLDTPGYLDFVGEMVSALTVCDGAVIVVNAQAGVESQTIRAWDYSVERGLARVIFVNHLDKEGTEYEATVEALRDQFGKAVAPFIVPIGEGPGIKGVVNVLTKESYIRADGKLTKGTAPESMAKEMEKLRFDLVESIVEQDEKLFERYLGDEAISDAELAAVLAKGTRSGNLVPVIAGVAATMQGVDPLLDAIIELMPAPDGRGKLKLIGKDGKPAELPVSPDAPLAAHVFKIVGESKLGELTYFKVGSGKVRPGDTVYNVKTGEAEKISALVMMLGKNRLDVTEAAAGDIVATVKLKFTHIGDTLCMKDQQFTFPPIVYPKAVSYEAIEVEDKALLEKVSSGLNHIHEEDPTLRPEMNDLTHQLVVYGMGELHLGVAREKLSERFGVKIDWTKPRVPYKETIGGTSSAQGKYKKQTGGRGQYGDIWLKLEPLKDKEFEFVDAIVGGVVPNKFIPAVEKGVVEVMAGGVLAGYPVSYVKVTAYDGSHHSVDSSEMAFKIAASMGFKKAFMDAKPILQEPIYKLKISVPDEYLGDVMGDLNSRRGRVLGVSGSGKLKVVEANVPLVEVYKYINTLRSMTQGVGHYEMEFDHYAEVPPQIAQGVIESAKIDREEE